MSPSTRSFEIQKDESGASVLIKICETPGLSAENLSLATWGSSFVLANQLHKWKHIARQAADLSASNASNPSTSTAPLAVLELGAGTSLVGLSAAAIWDLPVVVTDLPSLLPGLADNILANADRLSSTEEGATVRCGSLDWTQPDQLYLDTPQVTIRSETKAQIILAADTVYADDHPTLLTRTISAWLATGPHSRVVFCYVLRHAYIDIVRELWEQLETLGLECVEEGRRDAEPEKWDDVAPFEWCVWAWKQS